MFRFTLIWLLLVSTYGFAQHALHNSLPAGGTFTDNSVRVMWSVGEISGGPGIVGNTLVYQGVLLPNSVSLVTSYDTDLINNLSIFPNPSADFINMKWGISPRGSRIYNIYDNSGQLMQSFKVATGQEVDTLDISLLPAGIYVIVIEGEWIDIRPKFKIIKSQHL